MSKRRCLTCPTLVPAGTRGGRCTDCARAHDRARGTRTDRGYGPEHQHERATIQAAIDRGEVVHCWRCDVRLTGRLWHLDHTDDRQGYRGPACSPCNLELAGRASHGLD